MPRPKKCRRICALPRCSRFGPLDGAAEGSVALALEELEAIRLLDYRGFTQEQCAARMNISRATVARIYEEGRRKVAQALVEGRGLRIEGGDVMICTSPRPECAGEPHCCHRQGKEG